MAEALAKELKKNAEAGKVAAGQDVLRKAKIALTSFASLPPSQEATRTSKKERTVARDVYESAVLLSVAAKDIRGIERHLLLLRPFNFEYRKELGDSSKRLEMISLELLTLLVEQRLAEFHSLLELVPLAERENKFVTFVVELEQFLMEGSYNKVLAARKRAPSKVYSWLLESLEETVREEVASCLEVSYENLTLVRWLVYRCPSLRLIALRCALCCAVLQCAVLRTHIVLLHLQEERETSHSLERNAHYSELDSRLRKSS